MSERRHYRKRGPVFLERLETRLALAGAPFISEFVARNNNSLDDGDGNDPDWAELFNPTGEDIELGGWYLTDDSENLTKWEFPEFTFPAGNFSVVFASGQDTFDAAGNFHTNFRLAAAGDYLALVKPDGTTIVSQYGENGETFPEQFEDVSYGIQFDTTELVGAGSNVDIMIPDQAADDTFGTSWTGGDEEAFDLAGGLTDWQRSVTSVGHRPLDTLTSYRQSVMAEPSLLSFYTFENDSTNFFGIRDDAGSTHWTFFCDTNFDDAGCTGDVFATGVDEGASKSLSLNGGAMVILGSVDELLFEDGSGTVEAWLRPRGGGSYFGTRVAARGNISNRYSLHIDDSFSTVQKQAQSTLPLEGTYAAPDDSWLHVVAVFEDGQTTIYVNGEELAEVTGAGGLGAVTNGLTSQIGVSTIERFVVDGYRGEIDELAIYADAVDVETIRAHFRQVNLPKAEPGTDVGDQMRGTSSSAYLRMPFDLASPESVGALELDIGYNDGFVAYLNGVEVAQRNAPQQLDFQSTATAVHEFDQREILNISQAASALQQGENILAIHGLNLFADDDFFLVDPVLTVTEYFSDQIRFFVTPTPHQPNGGPGVLDLVRPVTFDVEHGFHAEVFDVAITTTTPGATLVYTTDGSHPTLDSGTVVAAPSEDEPPEAIVHVASTTTLRAAAFRESWEPSASNTATYLFLRNLDDVVNLGAPVPDAAGASFSFEMDPEILGDPRYEDEIVDALQAIPTMSLVVDPDEFFGSDGIYITGQREREGERPVSVEYFSPDGSPGFTVNAGVRIAGAGARGFPKRPMRLVFRTEYGPGRLRFPLFPGSPVEDFDTLNLRSGGHDSWVAPQTEDSGYIRDSFVRLTHQDLGQLSPQSKAVHLYINGRYWGMYFTTERPEEDFNASYLGGAPEDWDVLRTQAAGQRPEAVSGDKEAWETVLEIAEQARSSQPAYQELLEYVDIDNYIDSLIVRMFAADRDWAGSKNYFSARNRNDGQFKFYTWDAEFTMGNTGHRVDENMVGVGVSEGPGGIHGHLRDNGEYRLRFADRVQKHFFNDGALTVEKNLTRWAELVTELELAILGESARWGDEHSPQDFTVYTVEDWQEEVNWVRDVFLPGRTETVMGQFREASLYPSVDAPTLLVNSSPRHGGNIGESDEITFLEPDDGMIYYTIDNSDPREYGGEISPQALVFQDPITVSDLLVLNARIRQGSQWSALSSAQFTVAEYRADFNGDNVVDAHDIDLLYAEVGSMEHTIEFDLTGDQLVDQADVDVVVRGILATEYGDANLDGEVGFADFVALSNNFGTNSASWAQGDFGGDGRVDFDDFVTLTNSFGFQRPGNQ